MIRLLSQITLYFMLAPVVLGAAKKNSYYEAIQEGAANPISGNEFKKIEKDALREFSRPESYDLLATTFGNTTEKVWAVVYAEVYCNLDPNSERSDQIGKLMQQWYEKALAMQGNQISVSLSKNAESNSSAKQPPFETSFEMSLLLGFAMFKGETNPLSISALIGARRGQLAMWSMRKLPQTELIRWQETVTAAGHFEAYNHWLFKGALPEEFTKWRTGHEAQYNAWLEWQKIHKFVVDKPDFQRLYILNHN
jgi:hypothetical protein